MSAKKNLQTRLMLSVLSIVIVTILIITAVVISVEHYRLQKSEIKRIYYETDALAKRLGQMIYSSNLRSAMIALQNTQQSDPAMLFFRVTDTNGRILVADDDIRVDPSAGSPATIMKEKPITVQESVGTMGLKRWFNVYLSVLTQDINITGQIRAEKGEQIMDTRWDITYMGQKLGLLQVGFSRKRFIEDLTIHFWTIMGTGFSILVAAMVMIYLVIRKSLKPFEKFVSDISKIEDSTHGESLIKQLEAIDWDDDNTTVYEADRLRAAMLRVKEIFSSSWNKLQVHQNNLEQMVADRTQELYDINQKLKKQMVERKEIETRLVNAQKLESVGTLAGGIAHEFNNLFMAISGYAALIERSTDPDHPNFQKAQKIRKLVDNGSESIKQLLGFARSGKYEPCPQNINDIIKANLAVFKHTRKDLEIDTGYAPDLWEVFADRSQMDHIIMNLLFNASEAMPDTGRLIIRTGNIMLEEKQIDMNRTVSGPFVKWSIKDSGHGIPPDIMKRIFDPFFTTKDMGGGTGLGLASVYGIVENHQGFMTVDSTPGQGSEFCVFLPALQTP